MKIKNIIFFIFLFKAAFSSEVIIEKVEPPNWWIGMKTNHIQLMLYGKNLNNIKANFNTDGIIIEKIHTIENDSYAFIDIHVQEECKAGEYILTVENQNGTSNVSFPLLEREDSDKRHRGFNSQDIIYLITPDRFVNGNTANDNIEGMRDHTDRTDILRRHGGDIQGIINELNYIKDLGVTTIWINPLIENDMDISYHGYAATDLYKIDPRFGTNKLYRQLVDKAHSINLKIIMDHVSNHVGMYHPWVDNSPFKDWFHGNIENHLYARHDKSVLIDNHVDSVFYQNMKKGWFVREMPDLNQSNHFLNKYLIQNTIWWIESFGIDGIREDTYPYVNQQYLSEWAKLIFEEYPEFNIVAEIWVGDSVFLAPFQKNSIISIGDSTHLSSITDFGLAEAFGKVFHRGESINNIYHCLSKDFLYDKPNMLVTFLDNHDVMRLWDLVNGDIDKYKMALVLLLTLRGIPQIYYGTEIGLPGGDDHGLIRRDMPGGFNDDEKNVFLRKNLNKTEKSISTFIKKLIKLRKNNEAFTLGKLVHFPPENELYCYIRQYRNEKMYILVNNNPEKRIADLAHIICKEDKQLDIEIVLENKLIKILKKQHVEIDKFGFAILKII